MGYGISYKPRRLKNCILNNNCPKPIIYTNKTNGFLSTNVYEVSHQIQKASKFGIRGTILNNANKNLNAFGSWEGSPYGSKSPPRNKF